MKVILRTPRAGSKGDRVRASYDVQSLDELPETIPCQSPDCQGGTMRLREAVQRALQKTGRMSRMRCNGMEKSGRECWNMIDVFVGES